MTARDYSPCHALWLHDGPQSGNMMLKSTDVHADSLATSCAHHPLACAVTTHNATPLCANPCLRHAMPCHAMSCHVTLSHAMPCMHAVHCRSRLRLQQCRSRPFPFRHVPLCQRPHEASLSKPRGLQVKPGNMAWRLTPLAPPKLALEPPRKYFGKN